MAGNNEREACLVLQMMGGRSHGKFRKGCKQELLGGGLGSNGGQGQALLSEGRPAPSCLLKTPCQAQGGQQGGAQPRTVTPVLVLSFSC